MKYCIERAIEGISINGNEYLLDDNNEIIVFNAKKECLKYCLSVGLDETYIGLWEER